MTGTLWSAFEVAEYCGWASVDTARAAIARWRRERGLRPIGRDSVTGAKLYLALEVRASRAAELTDADTHDLDQGTQS